MKKYFCLIFITAVLLVLNSTVLKASIVDELNYVNDKSDLYSYVNFTKVMKFISAKGLDVNDLDAMVTNGSSDETDRIINDFGIKLSDVNEFLMVMNTRDIEKKSGFLIFISFKNGKGVIPESFRKNCIKLKSGIVYKASAEQDVVFTKVNDFFVIGSSEYLDSFLEKKSQKKNLLSAKSSSFIKNAASKSIFFQLTVSEYLKTMMNGALNSGEGMAKGLKENVFIQTLLSLESFDWGIETNNKIIFRSGLQGSKIEDSERLQMLCHTWIVGSSFVVSFADLMAARAGGETLNELTSDQKLMLWLQKAFGRIHVKQEDKGVVISFEMNPEETDVMISFLKKEIDKNKKMNAERLEREKVKKLTLAVTEGNVETVQKYIKEKYKLDGLDTDGKTPLGCAASNGKLKIAKLLVENGAGLNYPDVDKITPLQHAVKSGNKDMVSFLLSKNCDVNIKADADITALHMNAMQGSSEITKLLLTKGALINAADTDASTPLHHAAASGFIEVVKVLVENNADPELLNSNEQRPIDIASQNGHSDVVEFLKNRFKQEPKSYSSEDGNSSEDFNMNDESTPADEGDGDAIIEDENMN